ncbi:MAG: peptidylprolyl isomerase [Rubricoccaceae bacterium]
MLPRPVLTTTGLLATGLLAAALPAALLAACADAPPEAVRAGSPVVAQVGAATLTEADLDALLGTAWPGLDSAAARAQLVEQWLLRELAVQEARRRGLDTDPEVQRLLADSERATLQAAFLDRYFTENPAPISEADVAAYYEAHRERLALREPYVRVRHLRAASAERAAQARTALAGALASAHADSLFALIAREYADDPEGAVALAATYVPESRFAARDETLGQRLAALAPGGAPVALTTGTPPTYHVVQVADRLPAGTVPPLALVRDEVAERLAISWRRDAEAQLMQRLRTEARARGPFRTP